MLHEDRLAASPSRSQGFLVALVACGGDGAATAGATAGGAADGGRGPATSATSSTGTRGAGGADATGGASPTGGGAPGALAIIDLGMAVDLTPDGSIAVLEDDASPHADVYFYDTATGALDRKTSAGDPLSDLATAVSATGRVSALHGVPVQAGLWDEANGWVDLGSPYSTGCDQDVAGGWDVSADGKVAVGLLWNGCNAEAFRWTDTGGAGALTPLELVGTPAPEQQQPTEQPRDGDLRTTARWPPASAQYGGLDRSPALWRADGTGLLLDPAEMDWPGEVLSISADGATLAGTRGYDGFVWTEATGMTSLGAPAGQAVQVAYANAVAAGGALVFGGSGDPFMTTPFAFVWTAEAGMRSLQDVAVSNGVVVPEGDALTDVLAASADGGVVLGVLYDATGAQESFVLRLPVSAYGLSTP